MHGNLIATVTDTDMTIYDGGHQTVTTKSRLNALCNYFCITGEGVFQKNFQWYVRKLVAESSITGKVFNVYDFQTMDSPSNESDIDFAPLFTSAFCCLLREAFLSQNHPFLLEYIRINLKKGLT